MDGPKSDVAHESNLTARGNGDAGTLRTGRAALQHSRAFPSENAFLPSENAV